MRPDLEDSKRNILFDSKYRNQIKNFLREICYLIRTLKLDLKVFMRNGTNS